MSFNVSELASQSLESRIPDSADLTSRGISVQSVITDRTTNEYTPQGGGGIVHPSQDITTDIFSATEFLVPSSVNANFTLHNTTMQTDGTTPSTTSCFDDVPATCTIGRAVLKVAGRVLEDIIDVHRVVPALIQSHMSPERYAGQGSLETRAWKWNPYFGSNAVPALPLDATPVAVALSEGITPGAGEIPAIYEAATIVTAVNFAVNTGVNAGLVALGYDDLTSLVSSSRLDSKGVDRRQVSAAALHSLAAGLRITLPLSYIFSTFRTIRLLPLAFLGRMEIRFTLNEALQAIVSTVSTDRANFEIKNFTITADTVTPSMDYLRAMTQAVTNAAPGAGYSLPIDVITSTAVNRGTNLGSDSSNDYNFNMSTPYLKQAMFTFQKASARSTITEYACSGMENTLAVNSQVQLTVGSTRYPVYGQLEDSFEVIRHNGVQLGHGGNVRFQFGLMNSENYKDNSTKGGVFPIIFSWEKFAGLGAEYFELDSLNVSNSGTNINLHVNQRTTYDANCSCLAIFEHTRILSMSAGGMLITP